MRLLRKEKGFSLVELVIVVVIIGILATFAMPTYRNTQKKVLVNEAQSNLKLVRAAERIYRMETGGYIGCADTATVNNNLKLSIPGSSKWSYKVVGASASAFTAKAKGAGAASGEVWCIKQDTEQPYSSSCSW